MPIFRPNLLLHSIGLLLMGVVIGLLSMNFAGSSAGEFDASAINSGDTAWMLFSTALVTLMTPAVSRIFLCRDG
jgi:ammonium transporter, Amt family